MLPFSLFIIPKKQDSVKVEAKLINFLRFSKSHICDISKMLVKYNQQMKICHPPWVSFGTLAVRHILMCLYTFERKHDGFLYFDNCTRKQW